VTAPSGLRLVVFTSTPDLERGRWWPVIEATPGLARVLLVRRISEPGARAALRRLWANIRKHGPIFIPYRVWWALRNAIGRLIFTPPASGADVTPHIPIEVIEHTRIHAPEVVEQVRRWAPDLGLSLGAPVLREALFAIPPQGTLNLHLGKVPDFRGAPPGFWELATGATEIGATVHFVDAGLDTGPIVASATAPLYPSDTLDDVTARAEELGRIVLSRALSVVAAGIPATVPQPSGGRTFRMPTVATRLRVGVRLSVRRARRNLLNPRWWVKNALGVFALGLVRPVRDLWRTVTARHPVRVFTFHRVTELCRDGMTVSPRVFAAQVAYLARTHRVVAMETALALLGSGARLRRPVAVLSFDDAYDSVWSAGAPILAAHGIPGCIFACSGFVDTARTFAHDESNPVRAHFRSMRWDELRAAAERGWSVGSHTANHVRLSQTHGEALREELVSSLAALRRGLPAPVPVLAYPFGQPGDISDEAAAAIPAAGYVAWFSDFGGENRPAANAPIAYRRIELGGDHPTLSWKLKAHGLDLADLGRVRAPLPPAVPVGVSGG
jgi:peptidoglycan/xylan/chitin deacetylase (PgdA/CDA1 family)/folate-dependent phosphoribosylglycinamide formyltransferase PurN